MTEVILSLDIGTTSMKAAWFGLDGNQASETFSHPTGVVSDRTGRSSLVPLAFVAGIVGVVDAAYAGRAADAVPIAVATSAFWHSLVGIDPAGEATTEILTWADRRAAADAAELAARPDARRIYESTGAPPHSSFWPAKLNWLARTQPNDFARTSIWLSAADYLASHLFAKVETGLSMASGTGLCHTELGTWHVDALAATVIGQDQLPPIVDEPYRGLVEPYASRWPLLAAVPWAKAIGDGACSNLGVGYGNSDELVLMLGTSGSMRVVSSDANWAPHDFSLWRYRVDGRRYAYGMALSEGGATAEWARETLALDHDGLDDRVALAAPDSHGLTVLPYVLGMRSPFWSEGATACIVGITFSTRPEQVYQAILESVALRFSSLLGTLEATPGRRFSRIAVTGGGFIGSRAWTQMVSDATGRELLVLDVPQASLRGAAVALLATLGVSTEMREPAAKIVAPRLERSDIYACAALRQTGLVESLLGFGRFPRHDNTGP